MPTFRAKDQTGNANATTAITAMGPLHRNPAKTRAVVRPQVAAIATRYVSSTTIAVRIMTNSAPRAHLPAKENVVVRPHPAVNVMRPAFRTATAAQIISNFVHANRNAAANNAVPMAAVVNAVFVA